MGVRWPTQLAALLNTRLHARLATFKSMYYAHEKFKVHIVEQSRSAVLLWNAHL